MGEYSIMSELLRSAPPSALDGLRSLIHGLESLAVRVRGQDSIWDREFRDAWGALEVVYALSVDRGSATLCSEFELIVRSSIDKLRELVEAKITEPC
jgi:hypothetical protein